MIYLRIDRKYWNGGIRLEQVNINYRARLNTLYHTYEKTEYGFEKVTRLLKEDYPGNYTVRETFLSSKMSWGPKLVFEDEQEEIMWRLKYE